MFDGQEMAQNLLRLRYGYCCKVLNQSMYSDCLIFMIGVQGLLYVGNYTPATHWVFETYAMYIRRNYM